ncbi:MAG: type II toxin-antitoxin system RelE/ParE family toxin [Pseudomonadota bacterium]
MRRIFKRPRARADIIDIWLYTAQQWGEEKAEEYLDVLEHAFGVLSNHPSIGVDSGEIANTLRRYAVRSHVIYYHDDGGSIEIIRVLHERMNADEHLNDE